VRKTTDNSGATEIIQFRATIDESTEMRIKQIKKHLNASRAGQQFTNVICHDLVLWVYSSQARRKQLERFYAAEWTNKLKPYRVDKGLQVRWPTAVDEALLMMAKENIGTGNKSETMRVLIAFAASRRYNLPLAR
jgi:hypothetical protein